MHHKYKKPKSVRAGCLLCKPNKLNANKTARRAIERKVWKKMEERASQ